jgi:hypothetical protein
MFISGVNNTDDKWEKNFWLCVFSYFVKSLFESNTGEQFYRWCQRHRCLIAGVNTQQCWQQDSNISGHRSDAAADGVIGTTMKRNSGVNDTGDKWEKIFGYVFFSYFVKSLLSPLYTCRLKFCLVFIFRPRQKIYMRCRWHRWTIYRRCRSHWR